MTTAPAQPETLTRDQFVAGFRTAGVLSDRQYARAEEWLTPFQKSAREVADHLIAGGFVTRFQAERMLAGRFDGFLIGQYAVCDYLGRTDTGRLYKAQHRTMNRAVAIQILSAEATPNDEVRDAIRTQARTAAKLAHPNVVTLLDVNTAGDRMYLVQEFVDGTDLGTLARNDGPLPVRRACELVRQAALGLHHAHDKQTYHGRLTPTSIKVGRPGGTGPEDKPVVKVSGLGLGRVTGERGESAFEYLAPEQFADPNRADAASDLYSLGCVLHLLLTGLPPFPAATRDEAAILHANTPLQPVQYLRPDLPAGVVSVLNVLLSKRPSDRPTGAELTAALEPFGGYGDELATIDFSLSPSSSGAVSRAGELSGLIGSLPREAASEVCPWAGMTNTGSVESGTDTLDCPARGDTQIIAAPRPRPRRASRGKWWLFGLFFAAVVVGVAVFRGVPGL
jgi:eukaryotic-like serine/threonine-protein kinase